MRIILIAVAIVLAATPLGAQKPDSVRQARARTSVYDAHRFEREDTAAVRAAAVACFKNTKVHDTGRVRFVADTAWSFVYDTVYASIDTVGQGISIGHAIRPRGVRVERRAGKWVAIRLDPKMQP